MKFSTSLCLMLLLLPFTTPVKGQPSEQEITTSEQEPTPTPTPTADEMALIIVESNQLSPEQKRSELQILANRTPDSGTVWAAYGEVLEQLGEIDTAMLAFQRATTADPDLYSPWFRLGIIAKRGNPKPDYEAAAQYFRKALKAGAPEAPAMNELAVSMALSGDMKEAAEIWKTAISIDPNWGVLYTNLFKALMTTGDWKSVEEFLPGALAAERFDLSAILRVGDAYLDRGKEDEAIELYNKAIAARPGNMDLRFYLAQALEADGEKDQARAQYNEIIEATSIDKDGDYVLSQNAKFALFRIDNPRDESRYQRVREMIFKPYEDAKDRDNQMKRAIRALDNLIEKHPNFWNGYFLRAKANRYLDERDSARKDLEKVLELEPNEPNSTMELGLIARDNAQYPLSVEFATRAVELAPRDPLFMSQASLIMIDAGECERAWDLYNKAVKMVGPGNTAVIRDQLDTRCAGKEASPK